MRRIPFGVLVCGVLLAAAGLACNMGLGAADQPSSPIPVSTEAAGELEDMITQAVGNSQNGEVTVTVTEEQLTSYVALKLAEDPEAPFSGVQIQLREGQIVFMADTQVGRISAPAEVHLSAATSADGGIDVAVTDADFGPFPVPDSMLESLSSGLDQALSGEFGLQATGVHITNIVIGEGTMTITGSAG